MTNQEMKEKVAELEAKLSASDDRLKELAQKAAENGAGEIRFGLKATMKNDAAKGQPKNWVTDESKDCKVILKIDGGYPRSAEYVKNIKLVVKHGEAILKGLKAIEAKGLNYSRAKETHTERIGA